MLRLYEGGMGCIAELRIEAAVCPALPCEPGQTTLGDSGGVYLDAPLTGLRLLG